MITWLVIIATFLCLLHLLLNYNSRARAIRRVPGPKGHFIVGNAFDIIVSPVELFSLGRKYAKQWNGIYKFWAYPFGAVNIYNPADVETLLSTMKYNEKSDFYSFLKPWLGDGLLLSAGLKWQHRRKILTPAFHFNILRQFSVILVENSKILVKKVEVALGEPVDVSTLLSEFTLNSICETAMGTQLNDETSKSAMTYKSAIYSVGKVFFERFSRVYLYSNLVYNKTSFKKKQDTLVNIIHDFTKKVISDRREYTKKFGNQFEDIDNDDIETKKRAAMLDLLILAEKDELIDSRGIQEEVDTFMFEGHDTTASGLTFCLMLLANNKEIQDKIVIELKEIYAEENKKTTIEDLKRMKYLEQCIKESLRLYPPVHFISRIVNEPVQLSNFSIPPGTFCHVQIYDLHRNENLFENPEKFDPGRFLPENCVGRHPYAYIPFSAGPRNCIGQKFAILEMKAAVSAILREFELIAVTRPEDLRLSADLVTRNDGPVLVKFVRRTYR